LFLWDPTIELELTGYSLTELMGESNPKMLALYRDVRRKKKISLERAREVVPAALESIGFSMAEEIINALDGDGSAVSNLGPWHSYIYGCCKKGDQWPPKLNPIAQHFVDIEEALKEPTIAWQQGDMDRCAGILDASPVIAPYLWPEAVERLRNAVTVEQVTMLRAMVMLELMLSFFAAWDAQTQVNGFSAEPAFDRLFPDFSADEMTHPNKLFFEWLENYSGAGANLSICIPQVSKPEKDFDISSAKRQLRRWKSGDAFPSLDVLDAMFRKLYGDKAREKGNPRRKDCVLCWLMATATRRINFMAGILEPLSFFREPVFPFGHETVQEWRESRYQYWYRYWLPHLQPQE
jgi:hypothetical protein